MLETSGGGAKVPSLFFINSKLYNEQSEYIMKLRSIEEINPKDIIKEVPPLLKAVHDSFKYQYRAEQFLIDQTQDCPFIVPQNISITIPLHIPGMKIIKFRWAHKSEILPLIKKGYNHGRKFDTIKTNILDWKNLFKSFMEKINDGWKPEEMPEGEYRPYCWTPVLISPKGMIGGRHHGKGLQGTDLEWLWIAEVEFVATPDNDAETNEILAHNLDNKKKGYVAEERVEKDSGDYTDDQDATIIELNTRGKLKVDKNNSKEKDIKKQLKKLEVTESSIPKRVKRILCAISNGESHYISTTKKDITDNLSEKGISLTNLIVQVLNDSTRNDVLKGKPYGSQYINNIVQEFTTSLENDKPLKDLVIGYNDITSNHMAKLDSEMKTLPIDLCNHLIMLGKKAEERKKDFPKVTVKRPAATPEEQNIHGDDLIKL